MKTLLSSALLIASVSFASHAADYVIDTSGAHASINFKVQHLGYSWLTGRFNDFEGKFSFDDNNIENATISVTINTASLDSNHTKRDEHLRSDDFLATDKFPQATFVSKSIEQNGDNLKVTGDFTLRGITKELVIDAEKIGEGADPWGGYRAGFMGETQFKLADYGIDYDLGPASQTVYLSLHVEGIKQ
ncbi:YceI family protein [Aestuariibacter salexigens]|uniref:YceI family protein n=1 Tax=Aestuariibacter salexigens TaxID=226010 RepID=UPI00040A992E|nr:YceI family protein [Aestuariibacter salexigens]